MKRYLMALATCAIVCVACSDDVISNPEPTSDLIDTRGGGVNPNFHIYLCFGQSNMEGNAPIEDIDREGVDERFQMMGVVSDDVEHLNRTPGNWYKATPPLCRWNTGLTPVDYFGRTLVAELPGEVKVGVIVVAMGGSGIDAFDKDNYQTYYTNADDWQKYQMSLYGGNPYAKLVEMGKIAQQLGVIKGILLHQGESNNMQEDWPLKVKKIYGNLLEDLDLNADAVPLLAGEMLYQDQGGICWGMNNIIARLPDMINNAHIISSEGCKGSDYFHFTAAGYRELGKRYAQQMLRLIGASNTLDNLVIAGLDGNTTMLTSSEKYISVKAVYTDGSTEVVTSRASYTSTDPTSISVDKGRIVALKEGSAWITITYQDSFGSSKQAFVYVQSSTFPLVNGLLNPSIFETGSFDGNTKTLITGQWGFGGWQYNNGVDLSNYKYLKVELGNDNACDVSFRVFDEQSYWSSPACYDFGNSRQIVIDLDSMYKVVNNQWIKLEKSHIYIAGFWSSGGKPIVINNVYLTN